MRIAIITLVAALTATPGLPAGETRLCHVPPGYNPQDITVDDDAVSSHVAHGDCVGGCPCVKFSTCNAKSVRKIHGNANTVIPANARLAQIENGTVACLHGETLTKADCVFRRNSGVWVETNDGAFALSGQAIALDGKPGGEYVVASAVSAERTVPCVEPAGRDSEGVATGMELMPCGVLETMLSASNATGLPLVNYATAEVCTSSNPHPDGATFTRMLGESYCYIGAGAALNDRYGNERDDQGVYLRACEWIHTVMSSGYETYAAKRPNTYLGKVRTDTPIVWRPLSNVVIANP